MNNLVATKTLAKKLTEKLEIPFSATQVRSMQKEGKIEAVDKRRPGTNRPRWFFDLSKTIEKIKQLQKKGE